MSWMEKDAIRRINLYHIVHIDKLPLIIDQGRLYSDSEVHKRSLHGTAIGMSRIKERRMNEITLSTYPDLYVGDCVPFYFCPRSVMLYILSRNNHVDVSYSGGQEPIVHLVLGMAAVIDWTKRKGNRWVFTDSNAGSRYFNDCNTIDEIGKLDWDAIKATSWSDCIEKKQAEFLVERYVPWNLVKGIAVYSSEYQWKAHEMLGLATHKPRVKVKRDWYY